MTQDERSDRGEGKRSEHARWVQWIAKHLGLDILNPADTFSQFLRKIFLLSGFCVTPVMLLIFVLALLRARREGFTAGNTVGLCSNLLLAAFFVGCWIAAKVMKHIPNALVDVLIGGVLCSMVMGAMQNPFYGAIGPMAMAVVIQIMPTPRLPLWMVLLLLLYLYRSYNFAKFVSGEEPLVLPGSRTSNTFSSAMIGNGSLLLIAALPCALCYLQQREFHRLFAEQEKEHAALVRDTANAPTGWGIAVVFTDIQDSTLLWSTVPLSMGAALDTHHDVVRRCIAKHNVFEVKTAGDSFMIAAGDDEAAMQLCIDIQLELMKATFPAAIDEVYNAGTDNDLDAIDDDPDTHGVATATWNGPRVRVGIHTGRPGVVFDDVAKSYDYYGPDVNVAARVEGAAVGGQICCTRAVVQAQPIGASGYTTQSIGVHELKGVSEPTELFEVRISQLSLREFHNAESSSKYASGKRRSSAAFTAERPSSASSAASSMHDDALDGADTYHVICRVFIQALFSAFRKQKDKDAAVTAIARAWRIDRKDAAARTFDAIVLRVGPVAKAKMLHHAPVGSQRDSLCSSTNFSGASIAGDGIDSNPHVPQ
jgi:class 3 adenylate cyclase